MFFLPILLKDDFVEQRSKVKATLTPQMCFVSSSMFLGSQ